MLLAGRKLALDNDRCIQILRDAGHVDPASAICTLDFSTPHGLNGAKLEKHLQEHEHPRQARVNPGMDSDNAAYRGLKAVRRQSRYATSEERTRTLFKRQTG